MTGGSVAKASGRTSVDRLGRTACCLLLGLVWTAGVATPARAQAAADVLTLDTAIGLALSSNRLLKSAAIDQQRAADDVAALNTRRFPVLDVKLFEGAFLSPVQFTFREGAFGTFPATGPVPSSDLSVDSPRRLSTAILFSAVQPLTQLRKISRGKALLELGGGLADEKLRDKRQQLIADVRRAYYGLQQTDAGLAALPDTLAQFEELDRVVAQYVDAQVTLPAEHLAVRTERARIERSGVVLRNLHATLTERMNLLIGRDLGTPFVVTALAAPTLDERSIDAAVATAKSSRPVVREAQLDARRAAADLDLHALDRLPDLSLALGVLHLANVDVLPRSVAAASLVLTWQPFDWGRRSHETDARALALDQARIGVAEAQAQVELDVRSKARAVAEAHAGIGVAQLARDTAAERLRVTTDHYRVEASLLKDVLEAQTAMAQATQAYQQALGAFWTARADFDQAVGDQQ